MRFTTEQVYGNRLGAEDFTERANNRNICGMVDVPQLLPSRERGLRHPFLNQFGDPMNAKKSSENNWAGPLKKFGIRHRKFYATRQTFVTESIERGGSPLAVAQYCGTSLAMIQADYCGTLGLKLDQTVSNRWSIKL